MTASIKFPTCMVWKCDECGYRGRWTKSWFSYGSMIMEEVMPNEMPTLCSDKCMKKFDAKIKSGEVQVPDVKTRGYGYKITGERKGY